jgi:N-methylhydantoinase A
MARFTELHESAFGYSSREPIQTTAVKLVGRGLSKTPRVPFQLVRADELAGAHGERRAYFGPRYGWLSAVLMSRAAVKFDPLMGPCIVEEYDCTIVVPPQWTIHRDGWNNLVMQRNN